jgi:hypothetical protein
MAIRRAAMGIGFLAALCAETQPGAALLPRIREHMQSRLSAAPNYTCRETIERFERHSNARQFRLIDTLLLEVAQVSGRELLAWPGGQFEAKPLSAFATSGLMTNGAFAMHARGLFFGDHAAWKYAGEREEEGRKLVRFDFKVSRAESGYRVKSGAASAVIPFHGFILADPESLDAVRIEIFSDSIAREIGMERADMVIEYQRAQIGVTDALLPKMAEVTTVLRGSKTRQRNRIAFSGCRQYGSESVISFHDVAAGAEITLPARTRIVLRLTAALDFANIRQGTPIQAVVDEDVTDGARLLMPKGARVWGTVRGTPPALPGLEFTRAEWDGGQAQFAAALEKTDPITSAKATLPAGFRMIWTILPNQ